MDTIKHNDDETIVLETYDDSAAAGIAKQKLNAAGITAELVDENTIGLNPLGGIELKIFSKDLEREKLALAREL